MRVFELPKKHVVGILDAAESGMFVCEHHRDFLSDFSGGLYLCAGFRTSLKQTVKHIYMKYKAHSQVLSGFRIVGDF